MRKYLPVLTAALALLSACASPPDRTVMSTQGSTLVQRASVTHVRDVTVRGARPSGIGSVIGAVLGSLAGSRIGSGHGRTAASIGGAVGGGMAGQHIEQSAASKSTTELTVRFDNGDTRTYQVEAGADFKAGDTVKVITDHSGTRITH